MGALTFFDEGIVCGDGVAKVLRNVAAIVLD